MVRSIDLGSWNLELGTFNNRFELTAFRLQVEMNARKARWAHLLLSLALLAPYSWLTAHYMIYCGYDFLMKHTKWLIEYNAQYSMTQSCRVVKVPPSFRSKFWLQRAFLRTMSVVNSKKKSNFWGTMERAISIKMASISRNMVGIQQ